MSKVLIVGSAALDSIKTPKANKPKLLGGAACYASVASSYFASTSIVAVVGEDFPKKYVDLLKNHNPFGHNASLTAYLSDSIRPEPALSRTERCTM